MLRRRSLSPRALVALFIIAPFTGCGSTQESGDGIVLTIDEERRFQEIEGFGASGSWSMDPVGEHWSDEGRDRLADLLFSADEGIGLSAWKFNAGATGIPSKETFFESPYAWRKADSFRPAEDQPYNWSAQAGQQWFLRAARDYGVASLQLIFYSPPSWMTLNGLTHPDGSTGTTNLDPNRLDDYVTYMATIAGHLEETHGISFSDIVPVNEPHWAWSDSIQEANRYAMAEIKALVGALGAELRGQGIEARIVAPEAGELLALLDDATFAEYWYGVKRRYDSQKLELSTGGKYREYIPELLGDQELAPYLRNTISAHSYWSDTSDPVDDRLVRLRELVRRSLEEHAPGATYLQTEYCILGTRGPGRDLGMESALVVAEVIHRDLTILNASEWSWWLALSPYDYKDGLLYTNWERPGDEESILTSRIYHVLGHYSRFVRPGYSRVEVEADDLPQGLLPSAYLAPDGSRLVVVVVNTAESPASVRPATGRRFDLYRTSAIEGEEIALVGRLRPGEPLTIPPRSVVTLVSTQE